MGGTFDPIHFGHLVIAEEAWRAFQLERVLFVPARQPPHKAQLPCASAEDRYAMALLAVADNPHFDLSRMELEREGPSYTVVTIRALWEQHGPETEIFLIMGADSVLELTTWYRHEELIRLCTLAVANRPGYDISRLESILPRAYLERVRPFVVPGVDISATDLRQRLSRGETIRYLVPDAVAAYIHKYGLYRAA
ncbi:MAG: nicotinate-nucleotide adenylyltransferase [Armatimonadetes bacterium]|nr:nicotinate-nucleotide adenylyltransferase [Armatimonadota bacterium]